eukprot:s1161_g5.t1
MVVLFLQFCKATLAMSKAFKQTQDKWRETWLTDKDLCDAVAVVGPERQHVPFIRPLLATISQPLRAALYGEFREGQTRELILPDVSVEAFDVMIRSAYHLEPKLTCHRALHALAAARLYMIDGLEKYCVDYLIEHVEGLDCMTSLELLSESLKSAVFLPVELQRMFCKQILAQCQQIVDSPVFLETHGSIIASLIKLDEFDVSEDRLWDRLMEWSAAVVRKPELLGPFADVISCPPLKRAKSSTGECNRMEPDEVTCQKEVFRLFLPSIRFTQMSKEFFIDKAREHLDRKKSEAVTDYFLTGRKPEGLVSGPRCALSCLQDYKEAVLLNKTVEYKLKKGMPYHQTVDLEQLAQVTEVGLEFQILRNQYVSWSVSLEGRKSQEVTEKGTSMCTTVTLQSSVRIDFENFGSELVLEMAAAVDFTVKRIIVKGKNLTPSPEELDHADQVIDQLCRDLFPTSAANL